MRLYESSTKPGHPLPHAFVSRRGKTFPLQNLTHGGKFLLVAGEDVDEETAGKLRRALNRAIEWLAENEDRSRAELLRDLAPELRKGGLLPELTGVKSYQSAEFKEKVDWMMERGFLNEAPTYEDTVRSK